MASKSKKKKEINPFSLDNKLTFITDNNVQLRYAEILSQVFQEVPAGGLTTNEIELYIKFRNLFDDSAESIEFVSKNEVNFVSTILSRFKFSLIHDDLPALQKDINKLLT